MPINFPDTPSNGQVYTTSNRSWTYNSTLSSWDGGLNTIAGNLVSQNSNAVNITGGTVTGLSNLTSSSLSASTVVVGGNLTVDTNTLFVNATTDRVGIGTSSPNEKLTVVGNISATGSVNATTATIPNINGNTSFANNVEVLGQLTSPSQTLAGSSSVVTKGLLASQLLYHNHASIVPSNWTVVAAGVLGSGSIQNDVYSGLRLDGTTSTTLSGSVSARLANYPIVGVIDPANASAVFSFAGPLIFKIRIQHHTPLLNYDRNAQAWCITIGALDFEPTSNISTMMPSTGVNSSRGYVSLWCDIGGNIKIVTQKGTSTKTTSPALETLPNATYFYRQYTLYINNGTVYLYNDTTLLGSMSGAPTYGTTSGGSYPFHINHTSLSGSGSGQRRLLIQNIDCLWGSSATI